MVGYNSGREEGSWYFKDYTNVLIENANLNSQFARIVFVTNSSGHKKDVLISTATNFNIQGDLNKILFCSGIFSYKAANEYAKEVFNVLYKAYTEYKDKGEQSSVNSTISSAEELKKFAELLKEGIISQEEFNAKKKQLLGL
jgi:mRNA degradation ribonuclease J1/J2